MKNKELENRIKSEVPSVSAGLKDRILQDAETVDVLEAPEEVETVEVLSPVFATGPSTSQKTAKRNIKWILAAAALFVLLLTALFTGLGLNGENYTQFYIDINPSVVLQVNRFDKVNGMEFVNDDAQDCFSDLDLKGKESATALQIILDRLDNKGYLNNDAELYLSCTSKGGKTEEKLKKLKDKADKYSKGKGYSVNINACQMNAEQIKDAKEHNVSPAKYELIMKIMQKDSSYTFDELKEKSMKELKELLKD